MCWTIAAYIRQREARKKPMVMRAMGLSSIFSLRRMGYTTISKIGMKTMIEMAVLRVRKWKIQLGACLSTYDRSSASGRSACRGPPSGQPGKRSWTRTGSSKPRRWGRLERISLFHQIRSVAFGLQAKTLHARNALFSSSMK